MGVSVGGTGVSVGGIGVSVGGTGVVVGGTSVAVDAGSAVEQPTQNVTIDIVEIMSFVCFISSYLSNYSYEGEKWAKWDTVTICPKNS